MFARGGFAEAGRFPKPPLVSHRGPGQTGAVADDLRSFDGFFVHDKWPAAPCPTCKQGDLQVGIDSDGRPLMKAVAAAEAARAQAHDNWEPDWLYGVFHGLLVCSRPQCGERVAVAGDYNTSDSDEPGQQYTDYYQLRFALPPIPLMIPPAATPASVIERLELANLVVWADPSSAANALRRCVEAVLDDQKVNKTVKKKAGGRRPLTTHERITAFKTKDQLAAQSLEAVK